MKTPIKCLLFYKYLNNSRKKELGFTLIELLVVVIILGILMSVSLPNLIAQVGKAREAEAKNALGIVGRAQQSYHFEHSTFASNVGQLGLGSNLPNQFYNYPDADVATSTIATQRAVAISSDIDRTRDYAIGVYFNNGSFDFNLCESVAIGQVVEAATVATDGCTNNGTIIQ